MTRTTTEEYYKKSKLDNGLTVVSENVPGINSVAVGVWVKTGSRNESKEQVGITHFLEHMLFKGTKSRSAYDIALSMEAVGGYLNAFTSTEYTCYYARCVDEELDTAVEVLSDILLHPTFPEHEIDKEKKVVLEEMKMYRDSPDDYALEQFNKMLFPDHPLGRPVIGYEDSILHITRDDLHNYMNNRYLPNNIIISVAGSVEHNRLVERVRHFFSEIPSGKLDKENDSLVSYKPTRKTDTRPIEQTHYILGKRGLRADDEDKYTLLLANTILGGGMSSRLHQNIREKHGYCYNIQTINQVYSDTGIFGIYSGTDANYVDHLRSLILRELEQLEKNSVPTKEIKEAKTQLKGKLLLSLENTSGRMSRLAKSEIYFNRLITIDELVQHINGVTVEDIQTFANTFFAADQFSEYRLEPDNG